MFVCPSHIQTNIILYQGYEGNLVKKQDEQTNRKSHYLGTFTPEGRAMAAVGGQFASDTIIGMWKFEIDISLCGEIFEKIYS